MSLRSRMRERVVVQTPAVTTQNEYGDDEEGWDNHPSVFAVVSPQSQSEDNVDRETRVDTYQLLVGWEVEIDATCRVILPDGTICRVIGTPITYSTTRGPHHIEAELEAVAG